MQDMFRTLKDRFFPHTTKKSPALVRSAEFHVVVPNNVALPLSKAPRDEISVPASINGRDLSTGRL
ncbi:hypothetical protein EPK99_12030 [Neorhizobium lilium]|uniref:Uncharacterized protein n=1 Tax=Neorhizobium lilium TaxID=2503024 RepID=A0A3S3RVL2_9HYPH|nr:hypothetical protein [Neorhizobium lilium]RWX79276.1 hypothetical protein EPK99_12030 [Neorhizobium lilium]